MMTTSQIMAEYHRKILRIPHGSQHPSKRYLTNKQILELFDGEVVIQEKVDGKLTIFDPSEGAAESLPFRQLVMVEDMRGKITVHNHVMKYTDLPLNKRIVLDNIIAEEISDGKPKIKFYDPISDLTYAKVTLKNPTLVQIHTILGAFSLMPSHFGSNFIEGLVIKNREKQLMAKWVNDLFEDKLP